jgi:hypothetical protein
MRAAYILRESETTKLAMAIERSRGKIGIEKIYGVEERLLVVRKTDITY